jgi:hypothetical protein
MKRLAGCLVVSTLALAISISVAPAEASNSLVAQVGPGYTLKLTNANGVLVRRVAAGRYVMVVRDRSTRDNFHLRGPGGFSRATGVRFTGTKRWVITFQRGTYFYRSDTHSKRLAGSLRVS